MRPLRLVLSLTSCAPAPPMPALAAPAALVAAPAPPSGLSSPLPPPVFSVAIPAVPAPAAPSLTALAARLPAAGDAPSNYPSALTQSFDGALAPALPVLEEETRSLFRRYLPRLYRPLPVRFTYETSKLGGGGGHDFDPERGHTIAVIPGETDARGDVRSAVGDRRHIRVQAKIEQLFTAVHEFAHAVFDDAVGRNIAQRPVETAYDALTEGFAVKVEQLVLTGMLRDADALGLSPRDAADIRGIVELRQEWLTEEDSPYAEGAPIWEKAHAAGGEDAMLELLTSLTARRLMAVQRSDAVYQLSLAGPDAARAVLGEGGSAELRAGFESAAQAAAGRPLVPERQASAAAAIDAAGPAGWDWLIRRALSRESSFFSDDGPKWIVPVFIRHSDDLAVPLFRLAALSRGLAERTAHFLAAAAERPDGAQRIFEERGSVARFAAIVAGAETLPWTPGAKKAWYAAIKRWITP